MPGGEAGWRNAPAPHYEEPRFGYQAEPAPALAVSFDDYRPQAGGAEPQGFGAPPPYFGTEATGDARYEAAGYDGEEDEYDEEYEYEDDEEEARGYGWKLLAGVVVAGAVIAGGGVYLYDMLAGEAGGPAPIIKADRGPAKTAPTDPGGRSFANQDSKLLGRLDSGKPSSGRVALDDGERSRVREVPTVRVSPDGRLILPKEPQGAAAGGETASPAVPSIPGINIVDNLSGSGFGGGLPPVVAKATPTQPVTPAAAPSASQPTTSSPSAPIIRNRTAPASAPAGNLATVRAAAPPPVPQKSEISSAWRMTGATASVAQPARQVPSAAPATPTTTAATTGASTLGAASVARSAGRQYVAVIATKSSRMEALQSFAELQQRHPQALSNRVPSVQKADLSSRGLGTMYRLLVGPAGSRGAANEVCASLKAGGYSGCWVKAN